MSIRACHSCLTTFVKDVKQVKQVEPLATLPHTTLPCHLPYLSLLPTTLLLHASYTVSPLDTDTDIHTAKGNTEAPTPGQGTVLEYTTILTCTDRHTVTVRMDETVQPGLQQSWQQ